MILERDGTRLRAPGGALLPLPRQFEPTELALIGNSFVIEREGLIAVYAGYDQSTSTGLFYVTSLVLPRPVALVGSWFLQQPVERDDWWNERLPQILAVHGVDASQLRPMWRDRLEISGE